MRCLQISIVCTFNLGTILQLKLCAQVSTFLVDSAVPEEALYFGDHFPHVSWQKR